MTSAKQAKRAERRANPKQQTLRWFTMREVLEIVEAPEVTSAMPPPSAESSPGPKYGPGLGRKPRPEKRRRT